ncbi:MAG: Serine/threonine protein kinase with repeat [Verrucomicrobiales bacterium]|nr:Serine/threonine protein kinase with repeat [Verrucomicrobiales bacterium]
MHNSFNTGDGPGGKPPGAIPVIPDHTLIRCIGRGSYGEVWLGQNVFGVFRAVKIVYARNFPNPIPFKREFNGIKRFEPVSRSHDGFIDVLQVGQNEEGGYFYYVMELADDVESGQKINPETYEPKSLASEQGKRQRFSVPECVELGSAIASALWHLHQNNLVHRDVKPSNIIFVHGRPKLADIGLVADQSEAKSHVGTEGFIPPEGQGRAQADIFSLGKVLYEMAMGLDRNRYPQLPSNWGQTPDQAQLFELNEVITVACEPEIKQRYSSAEHLLRDLNVIGGGGSVRRLRILERRWVLFKKWGAVAALLTVIGLTGFFLGYRDLKKKEEARVQKVRSLVSYGCRVMEDGDLFGALSWFAEALKLDHKDPVAERMHRTRIAAVTRACPKLVDCWLQEGMGICARFSPNGRYIATADSGGVIHVYELGKREPVGKSITHGQTNGATYSVCFSPDSKTLLTTGGDTCARRWNWRTGEKEGKDLEHPTNVYGAEFSPDGRRIVTSSEDSTATIWDAATAERLRRLVGHGEVINSALFSHDGSKVVTTSQDCSAIVWDANTGARLFPLKHDGWVFYAAFSPDDQFIVTTSWDKTAQLWNATTGQPCYKPFEHAGGVSWADFSPDGRYLVTAGYDTVAKVWNLKTGGLASPALDHGAQVMSAEFSPDARLLVTSCADQAVRVWNLEGNGWLPPTISGVVSLYGNSRCMVKGKIVTWLQEGVSATNSLVLTNAGPVEQVFWNRKGTHLAMLSQPLIEGAQPILACWALTNGTRAGSFTLPDQQRSQWELADNGRHALSWKGGVLKFWDLHYGRLVYSLPPSSQAIHSATFSPNGEYFCVVINQNASVYASKTGRIVSGTLSHERPISSAEFSPDSQRLLTSCSDSTIKPLYAQVWDIFSGKPLNGRLWHKDGVLFATFSPNGKLIATSGEDCSARIWDASTGFEICPPLKHQDHIRRIRFNEDSRWVVTASVDGTARVWDALTGEAVTPPLPHPERVLDASFYKNGTAIRTQTDSGAQFLWDLLPDQRSISAVCAMAEFLSGSTASSTNSVIAQQRDMLDRLFQVKDAGGLGIPERTDSFLWHERQAEAAERGNQPFAAQFHLNLFLQMQPDNPVLYRRRAAAKAGLGRWSEAELDLKHALTGETTSVQAWTCYARVCLALKHTNDYYSACSHLSALCGEASPNEITAIIETLCLLPQQNLDQLSALKKKDSALRRHERLFGALEFRSGHFSEAEKYLILKRKHVDFQGEDAITLLFATMNHLKCNRTREAGEAFYRADSWVRVANTPRTFEARGDFLPWERRFDLQVLHAEATAAMTAALSWKQEKAPDAPVESFKD